jgi:hypothetical protein
MELICPLSPAPPMTILVTGGAGYGLRPTA